MSKYTSQEIDEMCNAMLKEYRCHRPAVRRLRAFASLLRQEEAENRRDPVKEPVSVEGTCAGYGLPGANGMLSVVRVLVDVLQDEGEKAGIKRGDRVRVVKIEETT